jgi:hypothetical protein
VLLADDGMNLRVGVGIFIPEDNEAQRFIDKEVAPNDQLASTQETMNNRNPQEDLFYTPKESER